MTDSTDISLADHCRAVIARESCNWSGDPATSTVRLAERVLELCEGGVAILDYLKETGCKLVVRPDDTVAFKAAVTPTRRKRNGRK